MKYTNEATVLSDEEKYQIEDFLSSYFIPTTNKRLATSWDKLSDYLKVLFKAHNSRLVKVYYSMSMDSNSDLLQYISNHYINNSVRPYIETFVEHYGDFYHITTEMHPYEIEVSLHRKITIDTFLKQKDESGTV